MWLPAAVCALLGSQGDAQLHSQLWRRPFLIRPHPIQQTPDSGQRVRVSAVRNVWQAGRSSFDCSHDIAVAGITASSSWPWRQWTKSPFLAIASRCTTDSRGKILPHPHRHWQPPTDLACPAAARQRPRRHATPPSWRKRSPVEGLCPIGQPGIALLERVRSRTWGGGPGDMPKAG